MGNAIRLCDKGPSDGSYVLAALYMIGLFPWSPYLLDRLPFFCLLRLSSEHAQPATYLFNPSTPEAQSASAALNDLGTAPSHLHKPNDFTNSPLIRGHTRI